MKTTATSLHRIARFLFPRLGCRRFLAEPSYRDEIYRFINEYSVGGFVLFEGDTDAVRTVVEQVRKENQELLLAADCEDGVTMRFPGGTEFPSMWALGTADDLSATYTVARSIAREMLALGLDWNFAPVADINTNPNNPIVNIRSFGETPKLVADHVHAYIRGMQDTGIIACAKHFPGHGDTSVDSHRELPVLDVTRKRLKGTELAPFVEAIRSGVKSVMTSHIAVPAIDPSGEPASLSEPLTNGLLRKELGFKGIVVTDALEMHAITNHYEPGEESIRAFLAGADVLELPADPVAALEALGAAVDSGQITEERLVESEKRMDALVEWKDAQRKGLGENETLSTVQHGHETIALEAARRAIRVRGKLEGVREPAFVLAFVDTVENTKPEEWFSYFTAWYGKETQGAIVTPTVAPEDMRELTAGLETARTVILALFVKPRGFAGTIGLSEDQAALVQRLHDHSIILFNFGNPYLLRDVTVDVRIDCYSASSPVLAASIEFLSKVVPGAVRM